MKDRWKTKVDALILLAEDQKGKPEGELAREKLAGILRDHPEVARYEPLRDLAWKDITTKEVVEMHRRGISTDGSWTGATLHEALYKMIHDYLRRAAAAAYGVPLDLLGNSDDGLTTDT